MACLLHDVGYRECETWEEHMKHHLVSADIAKRYLEAINYDEQATSEIVKGIARHNLTDRLPEDMTLFQMTVRDSDDIDRYDIIRTAMLLGECVNDKPYEEILESCDRAIDEAKWFMSLKRGTQTAQKLIQKECRHRISLLQEMKEQAKKGFV